MKLAKVYTGKSEVIFAGYGKILHCRSDSPRDDGSR